MIESQRQENFLKKKDQNPLYSDSSSSTSTVSNRKTASRESSRGKKTPVEEVIIERKLKQILNNSFAFKLLKRSTPSHFV